MHTPICIIRTFDTEKSQRKVLKKLSVARLKEKYMDSERKYDGTVLRVLEPDEPAAVRWLDLDDSFIVSTRKKRNF